MIFATAALFAGALASQAWAQTGSGKLLSRDELRSCMNSERTLVTRRQATQVRGTRNESEAAAIRAEAQQLTAEQARIKDDASKRDRFGRSVNAHNARIQAANLDAQALRAELEAFNKDLVAYNEQCGGIRYSDEDKAAILKEREAPAK
jgi:hypothetical protein